jgi:hypothetical protein
VVDFSSRASITLAVAQQHTALEARYAVVVDFSSRASITLAVAQEPTAPEARYAVLVLFNSKASRMPAVVELPTAPNGEDVVVKDCVRSVSNKQSLLYQFQPGQFIKAGYDGLISSVSCFEFF